MNRASVLRWLWSSRLPGEAAGGGRWWAWCALSLLLVLLAPSQAGEGISFWAAPRAAIGQALLGGMAFLILATLLAGSARSPNGPRVVSALAAVGISYGAAAWVLTRVRPELSYSQRQFVISTILGIALALVPYTLGRSRRILDVITISVLAATLATVLVLGFRSELTGAAQRTIVTSALKAISVTVYSNLVDPIKVNSGGAIERYGNSFLLVTGDGTFYLLDWNASGDSLSSRRLSLSLPVDPATSAADSQFLAKQLMAPHKVTDMAIDSTTTPARVFVAYQEWNPKRCFTVRVAVAAIQDGPVSDAAASDPWKPVFETWPCVPVSPDFAWLESGGRLAWLGKKLLMTVGDFGLGHAVPAPSQSADSAYGKVLLLDLAGGHEVFTIGHRNPMGLLVDSDQRIWSTEHGPQGGDELNLLERGHNYGWPFATYGTEYGQYFWSLAPTAHDHGEFTEPVYAFLPSIGVSNLIRIASPLFPEWRGDLLIASLRARSLYRVRLRNDRVIYVESISLGFRIRDLLEDSKGRILLLTQNGRVVVLGNASSSSGEVVFGRCATCHESPPDSPLRAPSLKGIIGSRIAREVGYPYTPALSNLDGRWTEDRLDAFLGDPNLYAPGSRMAAGQIPDPNERQALIEFLRRYR